MQTARAIDLTPISYYIGRETIIPRGDIPGCGCFGRRCLLFSSASRNAETYRGFFDVPSRRLVYFGTEIEI